MLGYMVLHQVISAYHFRYDKCARSIVKLGTGMSRLDVPQRCYVEAPAIMSYVVSYLVVMALL